jgi:hypothetical protein
VLGKDEAMSTDETRDRTVFQGLEVKNTVFNHVIVLGKIENNFAQPMLLSTCF